VRNFNIVATCQAFTPLGDAHITVTPDTDTLLRSHLAHLALIPEAILASRDLVLSLHVVPPTHLIASITLPQQLAYVAAVTRRYVGIFQAWKSECDAPRGLAHLRLDITTRDRQDLSSDVRKPPLRIPGSHAPGVWGHSLVAGAALSVNFHGQSSTRTIALPRNFEAIRVHGALISVAIALS
jgi:hypothetical protein